MTKIRFAYNNLWRKGTIYNKSDQHPQYPWQDTQLDTPSQFARTRHGSGSGNGYFGVNDGLTNIGDNLILNGGFEITAANWTAIDCTLESYGYGQSGNCLLMTRTGGTSQRAMQGVAGLIIGKTYWFSAWVKSGSGGDKPFNLFVYDYPLTEILLQLTGTSSGTWIQYSGYFQATTISVLVYLDRNSADAGQMAFDTVQLYRTISPNNKINFDEGGAELTATLTTGSYNGLTLAAEIQTKMRAAGALVYTVTYNEATAKFTIAAPSIFTIRWKTGTHKTADISDLCGFSTIADDTGAATYTGDYRRIHLYTVVDLDFGSLNNVNFIGILNHNMSSAAVIQMILSTVADFSSNNALFSISYNAGNIFQFFTMVNKRYVRLIIADSANPNPYIQVGPVFVDKYFEPSRTFSGDGYEDGKDDNSDIEFSTAGVLYAQERPIITAKALVFNRIDATSKAEVLALLAECGITKAFIVCLDSNYPNSNSYLVRLDSIVYPSYGGNNRWDWSCSLKEII